MRRAVRGAAGLLLIAIGACAATDPRAAMPVKESKMTDNSPPMFDRPPPPEVAPVTRDGVRYQPKIGGSHDPQIGGLIAAYDAKTGKELWTLAVFANARDQPGLEGDVQDVFVAAMAFQPDGTLLVTDEDGRRYAVDVAARTAKPLS